MRRSHHECVCSLSLLGVCVCVRACVLVVVKVVLEVLARIALDRANFDIVLNNVFEKFATDRTLLEQR